MPEIGQWNQLEITKKIPQGLLLDGDDLGSILLPNKTPDEFEIGNTITVFLHTDSSDRLIATLKVPHAVAGEFARLTCLENTRVGAFFDLGIDKHLLVPFSEQRKELVDGYDYLVYIYVDPLSMRLVGSTKLNKWLQKSTTRYFEEQEVELVIAEKTDLGYKAIINHSDWGLLFENQVFQTLKIGQKMRGFIHQTRTDGKIDLTLHPAAELRTTRLATRILEFLKSNDGSLEITDKSPAEDIQEEFGESKKTFKKAVGHLYKNKLIQITPSSIELLKDSRED